jgi:prepilin-type N-terminal cleavage/methylation domain-containing protein
MKYLLPKSSTQHRRQAGFTIVELMIATLVFSMVLLLITYGVLHFTTSYYRGINSSTTQTTAQNATDTIAQAIQFSDSGTTHSDATHFCAGNKMFLYDVGMEFTGNVQAGNRGLYMVPAPATCTDPGGVPTGGTELLGKNMRVADISLGKSSDVDEADTTIPWQITIRVVYGDSDLLCSPAANGNPGGCRAGDASRAANARFSATDLSCRAVTGSQFCSVAALSTVAQQRIQ